MTPLPSMIQAPPMHDIRLFAKALLAGTHSIAALRAEFCTGEDPLVDLTGFTEEQLAAHDNCKVLPTPAICRYLAAEDELSDATIDSMELALERDYNIRPPWFIGSFRSNKGKALDYFYLLREQ